MRTDLQTLLAEKQSILADGATGTNLFNMGLESGEAPELWNIDAPEKVIALYRGAVDAGSDLFLTNSFGGNASRLALHNAEHRVSELNVRSSPSGPAGRRCAGTANRGCRVDGSDRRDHGAAWTSNGRSGRRHV